MSKRMGNSNLTPWAESRILGSTTLPWSTAKPSVGIPRPLPRRALPPLANHFPRIARLSRIRQRLIRDRRPIERAGHPNMRDRIDPTRVVERSRIQTHDPEPILVHRPETSRTTFTQCEIPLAGAFEHNRSNRRLSFRDLDRREGSCQTERKSRTTRSLAVRAMACIGEQRILENLVSNRSTETSTWLRKHD